MKYRIAASMAASLLALTSAGCSDDRSAADKTTTTTAKVTVTTTTAAPPVTAADVNDIAHPPNEGTYEGALKDVKLDKCVLEAGQWVVTGKVTNPTKKSANYRIYISLLKDTDTAALVEVDLDGVATGKAKDFEKKIALTTPDLRCVLRVERRVA